MLGNGMAVPVLTHGMRRWVPLLTLLAAADAADVGTRRPPRFPVNRIELLHSFAIPPRDPERMGRGAYLSGRAGLVMGSEGGILKVFDAFSKSLVCRIDPGPNLHDAALSPDGRSIALSFDGGGVRIIGLPEGRVTAEFGNGFA